MGKKNHRCCKEKLIAMETLAQTRKRHTGQCMHSTMKDQVLSETEMRERGRERDSFRRHDPIFIYVLHQL